MRKSSAAGATDLTYLVRRCHHAVEAGPFGKPRQADGSGAGRAGDPGLPQRRLVQTGQDSDCQQSWPARRRCCSRQRLGCGAHHLQTARGVHVQQLHSGQPGRSRDGAANSVGNVVKFEVQKNARPQRGNLPDSLRPGSSKEMGVDLEHSRLSQPSGGRIE